MNDKLACCTHELYVDNDNPGLIGTMSAISGTVSAIFRMVYNLHTLINMVKKKYIRCVLSKLIKDLHLNSME